MKKSFILIAATTLVLGLSSCGNGKETPKPQFNPQDRTTSTLSDAEREAAIATKKAELAINPYAMMTTNDVKLSILPPQPAGDITEEMTERIAVKMLQLVAANGIGGLNTVPGFALGATITPGERKVTGTAPQKMITTYTLNYKVLNMVTGDVYATAEEVITGVGGSFEEATRNAVKEIKNTPTLKNTLAEGSKKIIEWFEANLATFQLQVDDAYAKENYALALALIESVPQKATAAFEYAQGRHADVLAKFQASIAANELALMKQAMAFSPDTLSAEAYAHMLMLPKESPEYKQAQELLANYEAQVLQAQREKTQHEMAQAEADAIRQAAKEEADAQRAHAVELAEIEASKMKAKYQASAANDSYKKQLDVQRGFWGNLGARIIEGIDKATGED